MQSKPVVFGYAIHVTWTGAGWHEFIQPDIVCMATKIYKDVDFVLDNFFDNGVCPFVKNHHQHRVPDHFSLMHLTNLAGRGLSEVVEWCVKT